MQKYEKFLFSTIPGIGYCVQWKRFEMIYISFCSVANPLIKGKHYYLLYYGNVSRSFFLVCKIISDKQKELSLTPTPTGNKLFLPQILPVAYKLPSPGVVHRVFLRRI